MLTRIILSLATAGLALGSSSCLVKETTSVDGRVVDEKYIVKRPVKKVIQNLEFE